MWPILILILGVVLIIVFSRELSRSKGGKDGAKELSHRFVTDVYTERYVVCFFGSGMRQMTANVPRYKRDLNFTDIVLGLRGSRYKEPQIEKKVVAWFFEFIAEAYKLPKETGRDEILDAYRTDPQVVLLEGIKIKEREEE